MMFSCAIAILIKIKINYLPLLLREPCDSRVQPPQPKLKVLSVGLQLIFLFVID